MGDELKFSLDTDNPQVSTVGTFVAPDAALIGRVRVDDRASIWFKAILRGDNELIHIGAGSNIQDASVLHTDEGAPLTVEEGVTVGHMVCLHGCHIKKSSLIGMGSTILNHSVIGSHSIIGANSLVPEGKVIPDGVLALGAPCKVIRDLTADEIKLIEASALHYADNAVRYNNGLKETDS